MLGNHEDELAEKLDFLTKKQKFKEKIGYRKAFFISGKYTKQGESSTDHFQTVFSTAKISCDDIKVCRRNSLILKKLPWQ